MNHFWMISCELLCTVIIIIIINLIILILIILTDIINMLIRVILILVNRDITVLISVPLFRLSLHDPLRDLIRLGEIFVQVMFFIHIATF